MFSFVHETFLTIDSTANRAKYNKAQARATLDHILQVWWTCVCVCPCHPARLIPFGGICCAVLLQYRPMPLPFHIFSFFPCAGCRWRFGERNGVWLWCENTMRSTAPFLFAYVRVGLLVAPRVFFTLLIVSMLHTRWQIRVGEPEAPLPPPLTSPREPSPKPHSRSARR